MLLLLLLSASGPATDPSPLPVVAVAVLADDDEEEDEPESHNAGDPIVPLKCVLLDVLWLLSLLLLLGLRLLLFITGIADADADDEEEEAPPLAPTGFVPALYIDVAAIECLALNVVGDVRSASEVSLNTSAGFVMVLPNDAVRDGEDVDADVDNTEGAPPSGRRSRGRPKAVVDPGPTPPPMLPVLPLRASTSSGRLMSSSRMSLIRAFTEGGRPRRRRTEAETGV